MPARLIILIQSLILGVFLGVGEARIAQAADARAELDRFVADLDTLTGQFEQLSQDADGFLLERSTGIFSVRVPRQFRWDYQQPFPQLIVADGNAVWVYDIELEQISVRSQSPDGSDSPLALLADPTLLDRQYQVSERAGEGDRQWLVLVPRNPDSQFQRIELGLEQDQLVAMIMYDSFEQVTEIRFLELVRNTDLPADLFEFVPPAGVDVLGEIPTESPVITPLRGDGS